jgi:hypothetical protein
MILFLLAAAIAQSPAQGPTSWLTDVYAEYKNPDFNPFDDPALYFTPHLVSLIHEDARLAKGEIGYVDGDPICQCQDPGGLRAAVVKMAQPRPNKAIAKVAISFPGDRPRLIRFTLVKTTTGWRIADISSKDEPSFLKAVERSNRRRRLEKH